MEPITQVVIHDEQTRDGGSTFLVAKINQDGELVLEGQDCGKPVSEMFGDSDYEYWLTTPRAFKDTVLLLLLKERFASMTEMEAWLKDHGIPSELSNYM